QRRGSTSGGYLNNFFRDESVAVVKLRASQQNNQGRQYTTLFVFDRTAVKAYTGNSVLTARIRAAADFDLDIVVVYEVGILLLDHLLQCLRDAVAAGYPQVARIRPGASGDVTDTVKPGFSQRQLVKTGKQVRKRFLTNKPEQVSLVDRHAQLAGSVFVDEIRKQACGSGGKITQG